MSGSLPSFAQRDIRVGPKHLLYGTISQTVNAMAEAPKPEGSGKDAQQRLKVLINSSTPIVVMETVEECVTPATA
jgi:hypothetical protein